MACRKPFVRSYLLKQEPHTWLYVCGTVNGGQEMGSWDRRPRSAMCITQIIFLVLPPGSRQDPESPIICPFLGLAGLHIIKP